MPRESVAQRMLDRARGDQAILAVTARASEAPDWGVGFHAQQAIEKGLKAALLARRVTPPRTHDLARLARLVTQNGLALPTTPERLNDYTAWAATERYEEFTADRRLDRAMAEKLVKTVIDWAASVVEGARR